ncbi:putative Aspartic proteinase nepenthesin-1 precursor [Tripterygium wilfordii]|uniref:Putative Aspartic proteinase nepenthesin-1 n=1 Tax=Tripterygium wilfordii TaxID=458696 RepID=A0A7J7D7Y1_TRIWF|nr:aspartyl protease AED3-like [Tripterygium wilfordii]KAF5742457.1 putative Aspartic proteinase nepenthesin-1 precursor [Tripterygium wilfordii]
MPMKTHLLKLLLALPLFFFLAQAGFNPKCDIKDQSSTLKVYHIYSPCSPFRPQKPVSWGESVLQMFAKDQARLQYLSSLVGAKKSSEPIAWGRNIIQSPTYILRVNIGTPAQTMLMALDTSNDAAWVPCSGCIGCSSTVFDSAKSTTFKPLGCQTAECKQVPNPTCGGSTCTFNLTYGGSTIAANLSQDNITLATDPIPNFTLGCIQAATGTSVPPQGLLGLSRGPLSLLSQTQNLYKSIFSYCLPSFKSLNFSGSLRLGPVGQPIRIKYTPLLKNPRRPSLYYVNMVGIRVARKVLDIPASVFAFNPTTGAGTIIDSGTVYTRLVQPAYIAVRDEFRRRIRNATVTTLGGFDTCYSGPIVAPTITFMFAGDVNMTLPIDNILLRSSAGSISCLAMAAAPDNVNSVLNVIANMQQQNHRIVYDVANSRLGIARELCS